MIDHGPPALNAAQNLWLIDKICRQGHWKGLSGNRPQDYRKHEFKHAKWPFRMIISLDGFARVLHTVWAKRPRDRTKIDRAFFGRTSTRLMLAAKRQKTPNSRTDTQRPRAPALTQESQSRGNAGRHRPGNSPTRIQLIPVHGHALRAFAQLSLRRGADGPAATSHCSAPLLQC